MLRKSSFITLLLLITVAVAYFTLWYYKSNNIKSTIYNIVKKHDYVNVRDISVSGFFTKRQVKISGINIKMPKKIVAGGIFIANLDFQVQSDNKFELVNIGNVNFNYDNGSITNVIFASNPVLEMDLNGDNFLNVKYKDNGYKLSSQSENDIEKYVKSLNFILDSKVVNQELITNIRVNILDTNLVNLHKIYQNSISNYLVTNIEEGNIIIADVNEDNIKQNDDSAEILINEISQNNNNNILEEIEFLNEDELLAFSNEDNNESLKDAAKIFNQLNNIDNNLIFDITIKKILGSNISFSDPTKIASLKNNNIKFIDINNFLLSNNHYKISLLGQLRNSIDDSKMSGTINVNISDYDILLSYIKEAAQIMINDQNRTISDSELTDNKSDNYSLFLNKAISNIDNVVMNIRQDNEVANELAQEIIDLRASSISQDSIFEDDSDNKEEYDINKEISDILWYEENYPEKYQEYLSKLENSKKNLSLKIHREKNLEFMINDRSIRDVVQSF